MKIVIFGLTISSSWGNGHATLWRGLCRALSERGHTIVFFERDVPYYAAHRDPFEIPRCEIVLYEAWPLVRTCAAQHVADADVVIVTSYCPDALAASDLALDAGGISVFYDLDTPVTLSRLGSGEEVAYVGPSGLADFDLVLSYTGGQALNELRGRLGARRALPLYGHVDPHQHRRTEPVPRYRSDLSYLGTYAADRQAALAELLLEPARRLPDKRFVIGGAQYPPEFPWCQNLFFVQHLPPAEHPAFFSSSRLTLNITRKAMREWGWCPSGRLFEAAACGTAVLSDAWHGLESFFSPGEEIIVAEDARQAISALELDEPEIERIGRNARDRVLSEHTSACRAEDLLRALEAACHPVSVPTEMAALEV